MGCIVACCSIQFAKVCFEAIPNFREWYQVFSSLFLIERHSSPILFAFRIDRSLCNSCIVVLKRKSLKAVAFPVMQLFLAKQPANAYHKAFCISTSKQQIIARTSIGACPQTLQVKQMQRGFISNLVWLELSAVGYLDKRLAKWKCKVENGLNNIELGQGSSMSSDLQDLKLVYRLTTWRLSYIDACNNQIFL